MSNSTVEGLERGVRGTKKTLDKMHKLVALGKLDPTMQRIATWIRLRVPQDRRGSTKDTLDAVFWWVKKHGIFQRDPFQIEKIEHPIEAMRPVIEARQARTYRGPGLFVGDCDTIAGVYLATLLGILGFHYGWETAKVDLNRPDEFSHVWVGARLDDGSWYALDPSTSTATPGWRPPVAPELFARWPEKPIEDVIGEKGMGDFNEDEGSGSEIQDVWTDNKEKEFFPTEEYGYGIPKQFGPDGAKGLIPVADPINMQLLPPPDTSIPRADLNTDLKYIRAVRGKEAARRIGPIAGQPDDHGPPYYRLPQAGREPYYKVESQPYPPGSLWNKNLGQDRKKFWPRGPYIESQQPGTPERQVRIEMEQPMTFRRRRILVETKTKRLPSGMGDGEDWKSSLVTSIDSEPAKTAADAGNDVLKTVTSVVNAAAQVGGAIVTAKVEEKYAKAVASATNKVAGAPVVTVRTESFSILKSGWLWGGLAAAVAGVGYVVATSGGRSRGRRRR